MLRLHFILTSRGSQGKLLSQYPDSNQKLNGNHLIVMNQEMI